MNRSGDEMLPGHVRRTETPRSTTEGSLEQPLVTKEPHERRGDESARQVVFDVSDLSVFYGSFRAVREVTLPIYGNQITALSGPSGCGKTTVIRCLNRMNDLIEGAGVEGTLL